uniref:protein-serine/threonine phosphatase n=1 Tax=Alexandrium andersonii TaxID=327968 RepID=A0A7S2G8M1_9DINO|mmetsp:Transcript_4496/g.10109  ORF Transcript_4496/g.10109 Transcript_4496/m.10109 type:complete len:300 (+) Transcript_4496:2-901(+)
MEVARFSEGRLPEEIARGPSGDAAAALVNAFHRIDELLLEEECGEVLRKFSSGRGGEGPPPGPVNPDWVGCTCVVCLVRAKELIVANAGDSRCVLSRGRRAVPLSEDHKPNLPTEEERINRAGGIVERRQIGPVVQYRVNGNLNLSRSLGDLEYKKNPTLGPAEQMICATPEIQTFPREAEDEFLLVACDGVWDVLTNQEAVDFVHERLPQALRNGLPLSGIMEAMMDRCISPDLTLTNGLGGDNMTAMLVVLNAAAIADSTALEPAGGIEVTSSALAAVEERGILPDGLCSCQPDMPK